MHEEAVKRELIARAERLLIADCALLALVVDVQQALMHVLLMIVKILAIHVLNAAIIELAGDFLKRALA